MNRFFSKIQRWCLICIRNLGILWKNLGRSKVITKVKSFLPVRIIRSSLPIRLTVMMMVGTLALMGVLSVFVTYSVEEGLFEKRLEQVLLDAATRNEEIQASFDNLTVDSTGALQEVVYGIISEQRDSLAGVGGVGIMLLNSPGNNQQTRINDLLDPGMKELLSSQMRKAVGEKGSLQWQSVGVKNKTGEEVPAIIVGDQLRLPLVGKAEVYFVYSLGNQQASLTLIQHVLLVGAILLIVILSVMILTLTYSTLLPVRRTAAAAAAIAAGNLETRIKVKGIDELAQLSRSFNNMAASLSEQFESYEQLSKLQQRFVSDVSHELRTPLSSIRVASDLIYEDREELPQHLIRSSEILHDQVNRFDSMLADLIEISRIDAATVKPQLASTDVVKIAEKVIADSAALAEKLGTTIIFSAPPEALADVDQIRVERIIRNLITNAIEYAGGLPVEVKIAATSSCLAVQVIDHGIGMSDEVAQHVFDRFYRADSSRKRTTGGTGLGLAISAEDAALHEGHLTVLSCPEFGSAFLLLIPRHEGEAIQEIPPEVDYPEMNMARQKRAATHPEDITFVGEFISELEGAEIEIAPIVENRQEKDA